MTAIRIDQSCPPVVLTVFRGRQTERELEAYIAEMDAMYARGRRYLGATLMLEYSPDPRHIRRIADWTRATKDRVAELCLGVAMIAPSPGFRFMLSTLLMIQPLPVAYQVVSDVEEAADWLDARLEGARVPAPRTVRDYLRAELGRERV